VDYTHDAVMLACPDPKAPPYGTLQGVDLGNSSPASPTLGTGSLFVVNGPGFSAGAVVTLTVCSGSGLTACVRGTSARVHSTPLVLGTITADAHGHFSGVFGLPRGIPTGRHVLVASGTGPGGRKRTLTRRLRIVAFRIRLPSKASISGGAFAASSLRPLARICVRAYQLRPGKHKRQRLVAAGHALGVTSHLASAARRAASLGVPTNRATVSVI
jgi:hypothetical protein